MKVLIQFCVPAESLSCDAEVPVDVPLKELLPLFVKGASSITKRNFDGSKYQILCSEKYELPLNPMLTIKDYGIENGDRLLLF